MKVLTRRKKYQKGNVGQSPGRRRALVADAFEAHHRIAAVLAGHYLEFTASLPDALRAAARARFDLVIVGMGLDESRAVESLHTLLETYNGTPLVCVRAIESRFGWHRGAFAAFRNAAIASGASEAIDFLAFHDDRLIRERFDLIMMAG